MSLSPGFEHFFMLIEAAAAGMGVALLPEFLAVEELVSGRLVCPYDVSQRNKTPTTSPMQMAPGEIAASVV